VADQLRTLTIEQAIDFGIDAMLAGISATGRTRHARSRPPARAERPA
jgi:hypothetical protein